MTLLAAMGVITISAVIQPQVEMASDMTIRSAGVKSIKLTQLVEVPPTVPYSVLLASTGRISIPSMELPKSNAPMLYVVRID